MPRNVSGHRLAKVLSLLGYVVTRQRGDHLRLTTQEQGEHHVTVPLHDPLRIGTFADILTSVANHHGFSRDELLGKLSL